MCIAVWQALELYGTFVSLTSRTQQLRFPGLDRDPNRTPTESLTSPSKEASAGPENDWKHYIRYMQTTELKMKTKKTQWGNFETLWWNSCIKSCFSSVFYQVLLWSWRRTGHSLRFRWRIWFLERRIRCQLLQWKVWRRANQCLKLLQQVGLVTYPVSGVSKISITIARTEC